MAYTKYTSKHTGKQIDDAVDQVATLATEISNAYVKPADGIPATDMTEAVQASLGLADTAVQPQGLTDAIEALDKEDTAVTGKYVSAVSEEDGIITVTREDFPANVDTTYTFAEGEVNGAFSVTEGASTPQSVPIHGLGSAAYTDSSAYEAAGAVSAHNESASAHSDIRALISSNKSDIDTNAGDISALEADVATIQGKIPTQASTTNQLADKAFVNSSIAAQAANFVTPTADGGQFSSFEAVQTGPYYIAGQLVDGTTVKLTKNDYAMYIKTLEDGAHQQWRALYNGSTWEEQYSIGSAFTAAQQAAIDSGITANGVAQITTNQNNITSLTTTVGNMYTNEQIDTKVQEAIDAIPAVADATTTVKGIALLGATGGAATFEALEALTSRVAAIEALFNSDEYDVMLVKKATVTEE